MRRRKVHQETGPTARPHRGGRHTSTLESRSRLSRDPSLSTTDLPLQSGGSEIPLPHGQDLVAPAPVRAKLLIYTSFLRPLLRYAALCWNSAAKSHVSRLGVLQNKALRTIIDAPWFLRNSRIHEDLGVKPLVTHLHHLAEAAWRRASTSNHPIVRHLIELDPDRPPPRIRVRRPADVISVGLPSAGRDSSK